MPEQKIEYELLEHKADTGFLVVAPSWEQLYVHAALALTDMLVRLDHIREKEKKTLSVKAANKESLLVNWLNEILFLFEKERFLAHRILFEKFDGSEIRAALWGEIYDPARHGHFSEVKAVTYHQLELGEDEKGFFTRVFLDL